MIGEFDAAGNNIRMFSASDDLNDFPHVCIDSTDRVLVVDSWNNRVVLLNKDLQSHRACSAEISVLTGPPDWSSAS